MDRSAEVPDPRARATSGPQLGDAFGALLLACWEDGAVAGQVWEFVERDDGFLSAGDAVRYFAEPETWNALDTWALHNVTGRVLDVGCGAGRHVLPLQQAGHKVVALDPSSGAIEVCRRRGVRDTFTGTISDLSAAGTPPFDTVLMLGHNLGLLRDASHAQDFLAMLADLAAPGAVIIGQSQDPTATTNPLHLAYHQRNRAAGRLPGQIRMRVRHQNLATGWFDYLFVSIMELEHVLGGSAWHIDEVEQDGASYMVKLRQALR